MPEFRENIPKRRDDVNEVSKYQDHKSPLKEDFNSKCGYCDCHDNWRFTYYEVDHFVPRDIFEKNGTISETDYNNLVYSCRHCNNAKRKKWPTNDELIHNNGKEGFIDPCDEEYDEQFERDCDGTIKWNTELGGWIYKALKMDIRERTIKLNWNLYRLYKIVLELNEMLEKRQKGTREYQLLDEMYSRTARLYSEYHFEYMNYNG